MIKIIKYIIITILLLVLFYWCKGLIKDHINSEINKKEISMDSIIKEDIIIIDSLNIKINKLEELNKLLKDSVVTEEIIKEKTIEEIKTLPLDSSVNLLKSNLEKYEKLY